MREDTMIAPPSTARQGLQNALVSLENLRRTKVQQLTQIKLTLEYLRDLLLVTASRPGTSINLGLAAATQRWLEALESGEQVDSRSAAQFIATVKRFLAADPRLRPDAPR